MNDKDVKLQNFSLNMCVVTFSATQILLFSLFPYLAAKLNLPVKYIIGIFSLGTLLFLWGSPFWSAKSDRWGRKKVLSLGVLGLGISFFIIVMLIHLSSELTSPVILFFLVLSRIIYGTFASGIVPVSQLMRIELVKSEAHYSTLLTHSLALSLGRILAPLALIIWQNSLPHLLTAIVLWCGIILILNRFTSKLPVTISPEKTVWPKSHHDIKLPLLISIMFTVFVGILYSSLGDTLQKTFELSAETATALMAKVLLLSSITMVIVQFFASKILKNHIKLGLFLGVFSLILGALTLTQLNSEALLWGAIFFVSIGMALIQPAHLALVYSQYPPDGMGRKIGMLASGNTLGYALGGLITSFLIGFNINFVACFCTIILAYLIYKNTQRVAYAE